MAAIPANPIPPRPAVWEVPDLKDESHYFVNTYHYRRHMSDRLHDAITTNPAFFLNNPNQPFASTAAHFLRTRLRFPPTNNDNWEAYRMLGRGGYGTVGMWIKLDAAGNIVDEIALKDQRDDPINIPHDFRYSEPNRGPFRGLLADAVINKQLNESSCENIIHLRGYSFRTVHNPHPRPPRRRARPANPPPMVPNTEVCRYRLYYEFAPYQSLRDLINRYRAWDQLLPEDFIWHVFDSLAAALQILAKCPREKFSSSDGARRTDGGSDYWPPTWGVVHFDIKPDNVFLGYEQYKDETTHVNGGSVISRYPVVKLADFGFAMITGYERPPTPANTQGRFWMASTGYFPPEQSHYGVDWTTPPNGEAYRQTAHNNGTPFTYADFVTQEDNASRPGFHFGNAMNVWNVAKVIYDLMTLSLPRHLDQVVDTSEPFYRTNHHFLDNNQWRLDCFRRSTGINNMPQVSIATYSDELINLIRRCLQPAINQRITVDALREATQSGLATAERGFPNAPAQPGRQSRRPWRRRRNVNGQLPNHAGRHVYFRGNTINGMPQGPTQFRRNRSNWNGLVHRCFSDHSWPPLLPPLPKWIAERTNNPNPPPSQALPAGYVPAWGRIYHGIPPAANPNIEPLPPPGAGGGGGGGGGGA